MRFASLYPSCAQCVRTLIACLAIAAIAPAQVWNNLTPDEQTVRNYRLSMENMQKLEKAMAVATATQDHNMLVELSSIELKPQTEGGINGVTQRIESKLPRFTGVLKQQGLSTRDYVLTMISLMQSTAVVMAKKQGGLKEMPPVVNPENVAFVEKNENELRAMTMRMNKQAKVAMGAPVGKGPVKVFAEPMNGMPALPKTASSKNASEKGAAEKGAANKGKADTKSK